MNRTVELVNAWAEFEKTHPDGDIDEFCRYHLIRKRETPERGPLVGGVIPETVDGLLLKLMGRISRMNAVYAYAAFEGTGVDQLEEFGLLLKIRQEKNPKKTEVIYSMLLELSSGTDMLARLMRKGFIREYPDADDKRSKRLELTAGGEKALETGRKRVAKLAQMMLLDMPGEDKQLCVQLLKQVEQKFSALFQSHRGKPFEEIYSAVVSNAI